jgi:hypothetical protein
MASTLGDGPHAASNTVNNNKGALRFMVFIVSSKDPLLWLRQWLIGTKPDRGLATKQPRANGSARGCGFFSGGRPDALDRPDGGKPDCAAAQPFTTHPGESGIGHGGVVGEQRGYRRGRGAAEKRCLLTPTP